MYTQVLTMPKLVAESSTKRIDITLEYANAALPKTQAQSLQNS